MHNESCLFCKIIAGTIPSEKIYEDDNVFAFLDVNPVNKGHALVIPKVHATNIYEIKKEDFLAVMDVVHTLAPTIKKAMDAEGVNIVMNNDAPAGQVIFHAHLHIIPRYGNDGFRHWQGTPYEDDEMSAVGTRIRKQLTQNEIH